MTAKPDRQLSPVQSPVDYICGQIKFVIDTFGPRDPGSDGEFAAQQYVLSEVKPFADEVRIEPFSVAPKAFMGFLPTTSVLLLAAILAYGFLPKIACALACLALLVALLQFVLYKRFLDPLFPKRTSHNVYAVRKAAREPKRRIIISGHIDAAYEWRYNLIGRGFLLTAALTGIASVLYLVPLNLAHSFAGHFLNLHAGMPWRALELFRFTFVPVCFSSMFFTRFSVVAPGANDNLTGVFTAIAALKSLAEQVLRFDDTEVVCLITGSEEAGLRGAKAFVEHHRNELKDKETVFVALDTLRDTGHLAIYRRDLNGMVRHHAGACNLLRQAAQNAGLDLQFESVYLGATDAIAFTQAGIPAVTLGGMDPSPPRYYHTRLDDWNNLEPECLRRSLALVLEAIKLYDRNGLRLE